MRNTIFIETVEITLDNLTIEKNADRNILMDEIKISKSYCEIMLSPPVICDFALVLVFVILPLCGGLTFHICSVFSIRNQCIGVIHRFALGIFDYQMFVKVIRGNLCSIPVIREYRIKDRCIYVSSSQGSSMIIIVSSSYRQQTLEIPTIDRVLVLHHQAKLPHYAKKKKQSRTLKAIRSLLLMIVCVCR